MMTDYFLSKLISQKINRCRKIIVSGMMRLLITMVISLAFSHAAFAADQHAANQQNTKSVAHKKMTHKTRGRFSHGRKHRRLARKVRVLIPNRQTSNSPLDDSTVHATFNNQRPKISFVASIEERLVNFVHKTVSNLRYSVYKLGASKFDPSRGIYIVDCSSYVDNILKNIYPNAYSNLVMWSGSEKPTTQDYYDFFNKLSSNNQKFYWNKITDVEDLRPGDIIVFRYTNRLGNETGGHMMIVMDKPIADDKNYIVRVADSAATGHSEDTRKQRVSGIGIGTILLRVDPKTFQPYAFAWRVGARLNKNVNVAMARPIDLNNQASSIPNYLRFI